MNDDTEDFLEQQQQESVRNPTCEFCFISLALGQSKDTQTVCGKQAEGKMRGHWYCAVHREKATRWSIRFLYE